MRYARHGNTSSVFVPSKTRFAFFCTAAWRLQHCSVDSISDVTIMKQNHLSLDQDCNTAGEERKDVVLRFRLMNSTRKSSTILNTKS